MRIYSSVILKSVSAIVLMLSLFWQAPAFSASCTSDSTCVTINGGETSLSKEKARQSKEEWNEQRRLRQKIDKRNEKEFDKYDVDIDNRDDCLKSANINAYWEPDTKRCLDINTGRPIKP
ncbi:DUF1283 family protein [Xenorhabdus nematophila]|uniref:UPF0482 protein XNC1_2308 n=1 Tax=Xenorhabdus nematophila (strain ATCC 19061 / DSM 3370 / CCUG 14189 / LMG 1036 / NCIMB 9965 / AN6) TaxID=406817 RepID=D3VFQ3_XENNA|nr:DUF1283 family protein [Xenorhabdus nematophila]CEE89943.1 conserved hypothetical protein; putative exported protein [Xenorhabdus nematophila str. Anatoliense]CEF29481.1 conserved hypothetical protein; putative exported protein [Xenorhabdus nematophila str. Websteri]AYA40189.1 DUF1283 family protein [Xenorhabdus nematophila]MBA0018858.1 DUF1283 family protein [Xenorhabdus nematophila]MCB4426123.1 DUF1283 family protein [Xenorhabdus nematophila]